MKKKYKKALAAGIAGTLGAGLLKKAGVAAPNIDKGRGSALGDKYRKAASTYKDSIMTGGKGVKPGKIGIKDKITNFFKDEVFTTKPKTKLFDLPKLSIPKRKTPIGDLPDFGLGDMDGAKYGKMIKASTGVMARGNKLARSKPTKMS